MFEHQAAPRPKIAITTAFRSAVDAGGNSSNFRWPDRESPENPLWMSTGRNPFGVGARGIPYPG